MTHDPLCPHDSGAYHELGENSCVCDLLAKADARGYSRAYTELLKVEIGTGNAQGGAGHGLGGDPVRPTLGGKS